MLFSLQPIGTLVPVHSVKAPLLVKTPKGNTNSPTHEVCQMCLASGAFRCAECVKRARYLEFPRGQRAISLAHSGRLASCIAGNTHGFSRAYLVERRSWVGKKPVLCCPWSN